MIRSAEPDQVKPYIRGRGTVTYNGEEYEYLVLDAQFPIRHGAPPMVASCTQSGMLAISDACPQEYWELWLTHELMENTQNPVPENGCVEALKKELAMARERKFEMVRYVLFRYTFFCCLVEYYERKVRVPFEDALLARLKLSLEYLKNYEPSG
jgi:hypothetical protein